MSAPRRPVPTAHAVVAVPHPRREKGLLRFCGLVEVLHQVGDVVIAVVAVSGGRGSGGAALLLPQGGRECLPVQVVPAQLAEDVREQGCEGWKASNGVGNEGWKQGVARQKSRDQSRAATRQTLGRMRPLAWSLPTCIDFNEGPLKVKQTTRIE